MLKTRSDRQKPAKGVAPALCSLFIGACVVILTISPLRAGGHTNDGDTSGSAGMPDIPLTETESFGEGLYAFRWGPYRNIFVVGDEGVIATDPLGTQASDAYLKAIREVTQKPIKYVAYSHSHWDHAAGGAVLKKEGAQFVSQSNCKKNWSWTNNPDVIVPDITFEDSLTLSVGNAEVELHHFGPIHDNCMSVMLVKPANKIFIVDIVTPPSGRVMPWDDINDPDFHYGNATRYLKSVEDLAVQNGVDTIIGAHLGLTWDEEGNATAHPSFGSIEAVKERREFYEQLLSAVKEKLDAGTPILSVHEAVDLTPFEDVGNYNEEKLRRILQRVAYFYVLGR